MTSSLPGNTSQVARLVAAPPGYVPGWQERLVIPPPAAGAVWSYTVDGRYSERMVTARWVLTTSAVAANRFPVLYLADVNGTVVLSVWAGGTITAGLAVGVNLVRGNSIQSDYGGAEVFGPMPDLIVPGGFKWTATTQNMDAGDQQSGIVLVVDRFPNDVTSITAGG